MIEYLVLILILFYFFIASIEDIKKREVYDYINYSLVFFILAIGMFDSLYQNSFTPIKYVGFGLLVGFLLGSLLYYLGIWGGGDAKFLIGFSAASYYLIEFLENKNLNLLDMNYFMVSISSFFQYFLDFFLKFILIIDIIFLILIIILPFIFSKNNLMLKERFLLFLTLLFLTLGLYFNLDGTSLMLIGFIVFLLIFFAPDELFSSVYIKYPKGVFDINQYDIIDDDISFKKNIIVKKEPNSYISKENLIEIKEKIDRNIKVNLRFILPYSILIGLNYIIYMIKIIVVDYYILEIFSFVLKFLFFSFIVGGVLTICILFFFGIKNYKKIDFQISNHIKYSMIIYILITLILIYIDRRFIPLLFLVLIYFIFRLAKQIENLIFVSKKSIEKVTFGDWIVQDIIVENKMIYSSSDFKLGVNEEQLNKIKLLSKIHNELKFILVKDGIAFIPPLFLGFLIMIFI